MPVLSIYFGDKVISSLALADLGSTTKANFEYTYSPYLYGHFYSEEQFNADVINFFLKEHGLKKANTKIIVAGLFDEPKLSFKPDFSTKIPDMLKSFVDTFPIMANYQSILTSSELVYSQKRQHQNSLMSDMASNMGIYNFYDLSFQVSHSILQSQDLDLEQAAQADSITIFGELLHNILPQELSIMYKLMLDLVVPIGVYRLIYDAELMSVHKLLLGTYDSSLIGKSFDNIATPLCTLVNVPGETVCLIESTLGTTQLVTIAAEDLFVLPLDAQSVVKLLIKNQLIGTREVKVSGGKLGVIFDTRTKSNPTFDADVLDGNLIRKLDEAVTTLSI